MNKAAQLTITLFVTGILAIAVVAIVANTNAVDNVVESVQMSEGTVIVEVHSDNLMTSGYKLYEDGKLIKTWSMGALTEASITSNHTWLGLNNTSTHTYKIVSDGGSLNKEYTSSQTVTLKNTEVKTITFWA